MRGFVKFVMPRTRKDWVNWLFSGIFSIWNNPQNYNFYCNILKCYYKWLWYVSMTHALLRFNCALNTRDTMEKHERLQILPIWRDFAAAVGKQYDFSAISFRIAWNYTILNVLRYRESKNKMKKSRSRYFTN